MQAQQINIDTIANNIANVNTTGFKQGRAEFQDLLYQNIRPAGTASSSSTEYPVGLQLGLGTRPVATNRILRQGALHKKSWAVIDRPYSLGCATVGALYERPRCIFCAKPRQGDFRQTGNPLDLVIDVTVSSISDATSLQGGILLQTPLIGPDGIVYALAQGSLVIGGLAAGNASTGVTVNHPTVGRIPNGANVERAVAAGMPQTIDVLEIELDRAGHRCAKHHLWRTDCNSDRRPIHPASSTAGLPAAAD